MGSPQPKSDTVERLRRALEGSASELDTLLARHRDRLLRMVRLRMDRRLANRIDASDVVQDTYLEAARRLPDYLRDPDMPFFLWLRFLAGQRLAGLHRHHLGVQARDARREMRRGRPRAPGASTESISAAFVGRHTSPSDAAMREELRARVRDLLERMSAADREILSLRHFEQLSNAEAARELEIEESAASKRYARALRRLGEVFPRGFGVGDAVDG